MPTLNWMGKEKVVNHHCDVPYRVLERVLEKGVLNSHGSDCGNMIIHGDNLEALKALLPEYEGKVDCIYFQSIFDGVDLYESETVLVFFSRWTVQITRRGSTTSGARGSQTQSTTCWSPMGQPWTTQPVARTPCTSSCLKED